MPPSGSGSLPSRPGPTKPNGSKPDRSSSYKVGAGMAATASKSGKPMPGPANQASPRQGQRSGQPSIPNGGARAAATLGQGNSLPRIRVAANIEAALEMEADTKDEISKYLKKSRASSSRKGRGQYNPELYDMVDKLMAIEAKTIELEKKETRGRPVTAGQGGSQSGSPRDGQRSASPQAERRTRSQQRGQRMASPQPGTSLGSPSRKNPRRS